VLRAQRQQRGGASAQPRWRGEGRRHHPNPSQEVPTEETEEREVDTDKEVMVVPGTASVDVV